MNQTVKVEIDARSLWALGEIAEQEGLGSVGELAKRRLLDLLAPEKAAPQKFADLPDVTKYRGRPKGDRIILLVRDGCDDGAISREVGLTRAQVKAVRSRAGLPANRARGPW